MGWYLNFCSPFTQNDPIINFNRVFQTTQLLFLLIVYVVLHTYYKLFKNSAEQIWNKNCNESNQSQKQNEYSSQYNHNKSSNIVSIYPRQLGKNAVSAYGKNPIQNESQIGFKKSQQNQSQINHQKKSQISQNQATLSNHLTIQQIEQFFPIVYGHHSIIMIATIMYSPYIEQSILAFFYSTLCIILIILNIKRCLRFSMCIWITMCILNILLLFSVLIEITQSNFDEVNNKCFHFQYKSFYEA